MTLRPRPRPDPASVLSKAVVRAAALLGLTGRELSSILGVSEATVSRLAAGRPIDPRGKEGELAALLLRVHRSLDALVGGREEQARAWLRADNAHLGGRPADLLPTVTGLLRVADYLDAMRGRL